MKKNLIMVWVSLGIFSSWLVFWWNNFTNNHPNIPWVYNPISWFYEQINKELIENEIVSNMNLYSDNSYQKFLDDNHPLSASYEATDLVAINSDFTSNKSSDFKLRKKAAEMFEWMAWAFSNAFGFKAKLTINSARRSQKYQRQLVATCSTIRCAKPWTSEHEAWLALDLWVNGGNIRAANWIYYQWLVNNAHKYGFHNSYQKWMDVDGKMVEQWHWRYVWKELATILHDRWQTFTEYFYENIEQRK